MKELEYPFDSDYIIRKKKSIRRHLLEKENDYISIKVAILGGSTTNDIKSILDLFLLNYGIKADFYESGYNQYYYESIFPNDELKIFSPDIIYIHTSHHNILKYPSLTDGVESVDNLLNAEYEKYELIWKNLFDTYHCPIIQNNFEYPCIRIMGNKEASDIHGKINYITRLNMKFYEYAQKTEDFYINDINYISSCYGLDKWSDMFYWNMYKYMCSVDAIPDLCFNIAKIIKSIYGKNKKGFVLDLDNTLWGGVIGEDGIENIELGQETPVGQSYLGFQDYLKQCKELGVLLNIISKNDYDNAIQGLHHPAMILKEEDFISIKANWKEKDKNYIEIADELQLLPESLVFVDDNAFERELISKQIPMATVAPVNNIEDFIKIIDKSGYFEVTKFSLDDTKRNDMYHANIQRQNLKSQFDSYNDFLLSLKMKAHIKCFEPMYYGRITQLINKSNQFNLTSRRYTQKEIEEISNNKDYITLYGRLEDCFGDNGVVSVIIAKIEEDVVNIDVWLMSCRVLNRNLEYAMMDTLVMQCKNRNIKKIKGYYYASKKNSMVKDFYKVMGFRRLEETSEYSVWEFYIDKDYKNKNDFIDIKHDE